MRRRIVSLNMLLRRLVPVFAAILAASSALAQLSHQDKQDVLASMDRVLTQNAYVPGIDMSVWRTYMRDREDGLERAEHPFEFANVVNGALRQFGVSHIRLMLDRQRGYEQRRRPDAMQDPGFRRMGARGTSLSWHDEDTAVIRVTDFTSGYRVSQVEEKFEEAAKAKYLVLDLRRNPGGEVNNMMHFLGMVLPSDRPVGTFVTRRMARSYQSANNSTSSDPVKIATWAKREFKPRKSEVGPFSGEVAVLVDSRSGSASEIVANALREIRKSPILGTKTAGAVLMSTYATLPHGFRIQFPVSDYVSVGGRRLEGNPLTPDAVLPSDEAQSEAAVAKAAVLLKSRLAVSTGQ